MVAPRKRARTKKGEFRGDNPSTPNINEAWEEETVATTKAPAKKTAPKKAPAKTAKAGLPHPQSAAYKAMVIRGEIKE